MALFHSNPLRRRSTSVFSSLGSMPLVRILSLLLTLTLVLGVTEASPRQLRRSLDGGSVGNFVFDENQDEYDGASEPPPRVIIEPFKLQLDKTGTFTGTDLQNLLGIMESVVYDFMVNKSYARHLKEDVVLEYVKFGDADQESFDNEEMSVTVDAGVASYSSHPTPDPTIVNDWVKASLESFLVNSLQQDSSDAFAAISSVTFALKNPAPPSNQEVDAIAGERPAELEGGGGLSVALLSGCVAGAVCVLVLVAFAATRRRKRQSVQIEDMGPLKKKNADRKSLKLGNGVAPAGGFDKDEEKSQMPRSSSNMEDGRSVAESESEWTVATEAGDSMALKNIYPNSMLMSNSQNKTGGGSTPDHISMMLSESFERDRQVAITKDMLTGQWSGRVSNNRNGAGNAHSESVLQPSHFSASQERRVRRAAQAAADACPDRETSSISSKESSGDNAGDNVPLVFEQAHEDTWEQQQEQPAPSTTSQIRTRSPMERSGSGELL